MAKTKLSASEMVSELINKLDPPFAEWVETVRQIILSCPGGVGEQVKWNSPAFYYTGEMKPFDPKEYKRDIVVMNLRNNKIMLVFPTGAVIKNPMEILEGNYTDGRRIVTLSSLEDTLSKESALRDLIRQWLELVEK